MANGKSKQDSGFLLRLRSQDTPTGVSETTVEKLMEVTGLNRTELVHLALKEMANRYLPFYEQDDAPLTPEQIQSIRQSSSASATPEESFTERLF